MEVVKSSCSVPKVRWSAGGVGGVLVVVLRFGGDGDGWGAEQEHLRIRGGEHHRTSL